MHNQPEVPTLATTEKEKRKHQHEEAVKEPPPALHLNPGEDSSNVGNKLLKRMGWQEGSGLGTSGEGRVEPVYVYDSTIPPISHLLRHVVAAKPRFTLKERA